MADQEPRKPGSATNRLYEQGYRAGLEAAAEKTDHLREYEWIPAKAFSALKLVAECIRALPVPGGGEEIKMPNESALELSRKIAALEEVLRALPQKAYIATAMARFITATLEHLPLSAHAPDCKALRDLRPYCNCGHTACTVALGELIAELGVMRHG